jgi:[acyl-carrier-protein] S-malonyltransferase
VNSQAVQSFEKGMNQMSKVLSVIQFRLMKFVFSCFIRFFFQGMLRNSVTSKKKIFFNFFLGYNLVILFSNDEKMLYQSAAVFPGQGSQRVGMGLEIWRQFPYTRVLFEESNDTLGFSLSHVMFEGPEEQLTQTTYAQPALFVLSAAVLAVLEKEFGILIQNFDYVAGHSLGEYSALYAAQVMPFGTTLRLIIARSQLMHQAKKGSMMAVLGMNIDDLEHLLLESQAGDPDISECVIANDNTPVQTILSGSPEGLKKIAEKIAPYKCRFLNVSGAFHSPFMREAQEKLAEICHQVTFQDPVCPVVTNVSGLPQTRAQVIQEHLIRQIASRVLWRQTQLYLHQLGMAQWVEIGEGNVLSGLARKTIPSVSCFSLSHPENIQYFLSQQTSQKAEAF